MKKSEIKRFVVLDTGAIIDLETWGLHSWGMDRQYGIKIEGNKVYETVWEYREYFEDINESTLLGTIVYSSDKPFYIEQCGIAPDFRDHVYSEYGVDVEKYFGMENKNGNRNNGNL